MPMNKPWYILVDEFINRIGKEEYVNDYQTPIRRLSPGECGGEYQYGWPRKKRIIESIYVGVDCSRTGGSDVFFVPLCRLGTKFRKLYDADNNPQIIVHGNGDKLQLNVFASMPQIETGLFKFAQKNETDFDMHQYVGAAISSSGFKREYVDGYIMLLSQEPSEEPNDKEKAFLKEMGKKVLWLIPDWIELKYKGDVLSQWDGQYLERAAFFPKRQR